MSWKAYEAQVHEHFARKYPEHEILHNQRLKGRHSKVKRQIDVLIRAHVTGHEVMGVFDCKHFNHSVAVKVIDSMVGFLDDVGANYGGVVSSKSFSVGARNRAQGAKIDLRVIPFISAETVIDDLFPASTFPIQETRCTYHFFEKPKVTFKQSAVGFVLKRACFWAWHPG